MAGSMLQPLLLPDTISADYIDCSDSCGLNFHVLKAGTPGQPLIIFCHGFPELAYSWRKIMPAIAAQGYYCVAPDQRGYGRTTGWDRRPFNKVDLTSYKMTNLVRDLVCLVYKLGYTRVASVIGHDFGAAASAMAALIRPEVFLSAIQMSHPHHATPVPPLGDKLPPSSTDIQVELAKLDPPRKQYRYYNTTAPAASHWDDPPQGLYRYLRGYFHLKSADWAQNDPQPLNAWTANDLLIMPEYYVMREEHTISQTIQTNMQGEDYSATEYWLPPQDLDVYCMEWQRTGFQGALNWYRAQTAKDMFLFAGRRIDVPVAYIAGKQDWGTFQQPDAFKDYEDDRVVKKGCFRGAKLIDGAGHWVQQEQPDAVVGAIVEFLKNL